LQYQSPFIEQDRIHSVKEYQPSPRRSRRGNPSTRVLGQCRRRDRERAVRLCLDRAAIHTNRNDLFVTAEDDWLPVHDAQPHSPSVKHDDIRPTQLPVARRPYVEPVTPFSFGEMKVTCKVCSALHWMDKHIKGSSISSPRFSRHCHHGKVRLDPLPNPPDKLRSLFTTDSTEAKEFRENIRQYNSALAFTSFTAKEKHLNSGGGSPWVWKSGYTIYHRAGILFPDADSNPKYTQLYFYDPVDALQYRMKCNKDLKRDTMKYLQNMLHNINRYKHLFLHTFEVLETTPSRDLAIAIVADPSTDLRRYNAPIVDEIAVVLSGDQSHALDPRNIILHCCGGNLQFIHDHHHAYIPLHYVLLFPYGTSGWSYGLPLEPTTNPTSDNATEPNTANEKHVTQVQFYSYRLHTRNNEFAIIQYGSRLFQQYLCDIWISTDQNRLRWVENHQPQLWAALYSGLEDAVGHGEPDVELHNIEHCVVLPSSYIGGPRYMNQRFQDAIAVARYYHGFDLFITFTSNSNWPDINVALLPGQTAADRPDVIVRVFNLYKTYLIDELMKHNVFGTTLGYCEERTTIKPVK
jgi:Helitron helicase-like domain at N-terminus